MLDAKELFRCGVRQQLSDTLMEINALKLSNADKETIAHYELAASQLRELLAGLDKGE
jgi:hypothetical protein